MSPMAVLRLPPARLCLLGKFDSFICLFVCLFVCLFGVDGPTREFFTHLETPPLSVKGYKF